MAAPCTCARPTDAIRFPRWVRTASRKVERDSDHTRVGLEAAVGVGGVAVRDMLDAIAYVGRDAIGQEVRGAHAAEDQERERRVDFTHAKGGAAGSAGEFHVRNEPT